MKKITNQFNGSHADRINNGGGRFRRIALFPLMLFMLLLVPTSMMAQTDYDNTVTFTALEGNPLGISDAESYHKLFDGQKKEDNFSKWCCKFSGSANVIFAASKAGVPVGYTITTGNDNFTSKGRNPMSWKLYGNNVGKDGEWTLIQEVNNDTKLQDVNYTSYDFTCGGGKSYKYFKWEISAIHSGDVLQVGEFELKLQTCTHTNADGSSALGNAIKTVETTCTEHGYTTYKCSICHSIVKKYKTDELKKHTLTYHEAKDGVKEHWQCDVCHKYFSDADATQEVSYASLLYPAYAVFEGSTGTLTFKCSPSKPEGAYDLNVGFETPGWFYQRNKIKKVVFDASFANARPTNCYIWFKGCSNLTTIEGIEYFNTENVMNMRYMFDDCKSLKSLDLTNFNTENVTDMYYMFAYCTSLESLDLTNFNTAKVTDINYMFSNCSALTTIYASDNFVTDQVTYGNNMFNGCKKLNGYDGSKTDHTYANYITGYFSKLVGKNGNEKIGASGETLTAASLALDDEKDFVAYEPFTATTATYNREMKAGTAWATLCLPFDVSLADKNFRAFKLLSANESTSTIQLEEITTSITAGTPVIIKMNNGETTLSISEANKEIAQKVVSAADGSYLLQGLYTKKVFDKDADNNCYIVKGDKLMNPTKLLENTSTTQVGSKPFRAYMVDNTSSFAGAKMFSIAIGDNTTAIDSLNTIADDKAVYYDLQGNRLNAPQKGINIVKRGSKTMKVIIK
ncbi:BspA family leucine-rich repeat surface protein [Segatella copri]|uniref:BspA family leucine-rich repeat surface protein n=1 Tax=Segatella copri TaxID=165179 RepID=UPI00294AA5CF|nr:BspA family leucine-rich repeat surface protein [Segatella copri]